MHVFSIENLLPTFEQKKTTTWRSLNRLTVYVNAFSVRVYSIYVNFYVTVSFLVSLGILVSRNNYIRFFRFKFDLWNLEHVWSFGNIQNITKWFISSDSIIYASSVRTEFHRSIWISIYQRQWFYLRLKWQLNSTEFWFWFKSDE